MTKKKRLIDNFYLKKLVKLNIEVKEFKYEFSELKEEKLKEEVGILIEEKANRRVTTKVRGVIKLRRRLKLC